MYVNNKVWKKIYITLIKLKNINLSKTINHKNKILLIILGIILLLLISKSFYSILLITFTAIITFLLAYQKLKIKNFILRKNIEKLSVPICFIILVLFNIFGFIKTLTGTIENQGSIQLIFVGVTFYILSAGAYISDNKVEYSRENIFDEFLNLYLYLILPFKLLAGPLENPQIINQFKNISFKFKSTAKLLYSFSWISLGLFMKFCISSRLTPSELLHLTDPLGSFICAFIFELKFYFDFAGYSFIVYGFARLFNIKLTLNFNHPFTANNVVEFWHKWHVSLGRFLQRYILNKNLSIFNSRITKAIFASSIFVISAMWHGGTANYFFWGLFHGLMYLFYIQYFKLKNIPKVVRYTSMFLFFVLGRMIAIDINAGRLLDKWINLFNYNLYETFSYDYINNLFALGTSTKSVILIFLVFIFLEFLQVKFTKRHSYHFFRKPIISIILFILTILFGFNSMELLYARI